jgi:phage terminase small subunit
MTPKQTCFVQEYLIDLNATQAAIRAGYSVKTARQVASENLSKPDIQRAIEEAQQVRAERTGLTQDAVVQGLLKEAEFKGEGSSPAARVSAWAHLGRHLGMFNKDKLTVGGDWVVNVVKFGDDKPVAEQRLLEEN